MIDRQEDSVTVGNPDQVSQNNLLKAATDLLEDVRRRHPGEELWCPYTIALDKAVKEYRP